MKQWRINSKEMIFLDSVIKLGVMCVREKEQSDKKKLLIKIQEEYVVNLLSV